MFHPKVKINTVRGYQKITRLFGKVIKKSLHKILHHLNLSVFLNIIIILYQSLISSHVGSKDTYNHNVDSQVRVGVLKGRIA